MVRPMRYAPKVESDRVDASLKAAEAEKDQCGLCGTWFTPGPDDLPGVCSYDSGAAFPNMTAGPDA